MEAILLAIIVFFAASESDFINNPSTPEQTQQAAYTGDSEGDINQIFGVHGSETHSDNIEVVIEKPLVQAKVDCYDNNPELVRDLTVPYRQRTYIRADGSTCTPTE